MSGVISQHMLTTGNPIVLLLEISRELELPSQASQHGYSSYSMHFYPTLPHYNLAGSRALFSIVQSSSAVHTMPGASSCSPAYTAVQPPRPRASLPQVSGRNLEVSTQWHGAPVALSPALLPGAAPREVILAEPLQYTCANSLQSPQSNPVSSLPYKFARYFWCDRYACTTIEAFMMGLGIEQAMKERCTWRKSH